MNTKNLTILGVLLMAVLLIGGYFYLNANDNEAKQKLIGIGTFSQAIDYGPLYIARHFGWIEKALEAEGDYRVEYRELGGFDEINYGLSNDRLHMFFSAEAPLIKLVSDGNKIKIAGIGCTLQQDVLVSNKAHIDSIEQLKGKQVAVAEGTSSHYGLLNILKSKGLTIDDITLRPGFPGEIAPLFERNEVDAWAVWPPFVEQQVVKGNGKSLVGGNAKIQSVVSFHKSVLNTPKLKAALIGAIERAKEWMRNNPDEAKGIIAQHLGMKSDIIQLAWPKHNWGATLDDTVLEDIEAKSAFLKKVGVILPSNPVPSLDELIDK